MLYVLGPLIGHGSDGDGRRATLMHADMTRPVRKRFAHAGNANTPDDDYPRFNIPGVPDVNFTGYVTENGTYGLHSQDTIHNAKKLINPMDQTARFLQVGCHVCAWEHLALLLHPGFGARYVGVSEHDLRQTDVLRKDRQNFEVVQRASSPRTRAALKKFGEESGTDVKGTYYWLSMVHDYLLAFFGKKVTISERVFLL